LENINDIYVGVASTDLGPRGYYIGKDCTDGWLICVGDGDLRDNDNEGRDDTGRGHCRTSTAAC
jgi:hypothetical protein